MAPGAGRRLVVMVREPVAGAVKTRLARRIGSARAAAFYRHLAGGLIARMARDTRFQTVLAITPDRALGKNLWPRGVQRIAQGGGSLGQRMQRLLELKGPGPVLVVGTDIPAMSREIIADAFRSLGGHDAVFGPATDGGFWLVGLSRRARMLSLFEGVAWSRPDTLECTQANLRGYRVAEAATLSDVDGHEDYRHLRHIAGRRILPKA